MRTHDLSLWQHDHVFGLDTRQSSERRTHWVIGLTFVTMVVELVAGYLTGSMALTADGWHMSTHAVALAITAFAYAFARNNARNPRFTFGTGKVGTLGGFTSAVVLALVALLMAAESIHRLVEPVTVKFEEAIAVAVIGLVVNLVSVGMLGHHDHGHDHGHAHDDHDDHDDHDHDDHDHDHDHDHQARDSHKDHNLRAAYLHVLADALTSFTAIFALIGGMFLGWVWLDPLMGIVGSLVIAVWAKGLLQESGKVLLDAEENTPLRQKILHTLAEVEDLEVTDLHLWRVGMGDHACIVSLVTHTNHSMETIKSRLSTIEGLRHITVEINLCQACPA